MSGKDLDPLIEDYLNGNIDRSNRELIEQRMATDSTFRQKVQTASQSLEWVRKMLAPVDPGADFEEKVSSKILAITQSNPKIAPQPLARHAGRLTADDPDAQLLGDPQAEREQQRLWVLAGAAALLMALSAAVLFFIFAGRTPAKPPPEAPPVQKSPK